MSWQQYNERIKAKAWNTSDTTTYQDTVTLPMDSMEVMAEPYVPEGGTVKDLYDHRRKFQAPQYGYRITLEYQHERSEYKPSIFSLLRDLIEFYTLDNNGNRKYDYVDYFVNFDEVNGNFENIDDNPGGFADYKCPKMIPRIEEDTAPIIFEGRSREKPRNLELVSTYRNQTKATVNWAMN